MLPALNRLRSSKDFARATKSGHRVNTASLVLYLKVEESFQREPQVGLIVSKAVGGSVARHRIARQLRHAVKDDLTTIPQHSHLVIRVIKGDGDYAREFSQGIKKISDRIGVKG